jgi:hypothetical protein
MNLPNASNYTNEDPDGHTSFMQFPFRIIRTARRNFLVSEDDLDELLRCTWTTRIWTYQEVILASRPVLVSGLDHLPWETFVYSMVLLNRLTLLPSIDQWTEIITSRAQYCVTPGAAMVKNITAYNQFVSTFVKVDSWLVKELLGATASLALVPPAGALIYFASSELLYDDVGVLITIILLVIAAVVCLIILTTKFFVQRSRSGVLGERCGEFESSLKNRTNQSLLNNVCYRQATDPRDLCFGILPMLQHSSTVMRFSVDYAVDIPLLYTRLANFFLKDCEEPNILALAAQAKCPGASSWVPDFSVLLRPTSESISQHVNPRHTSTDVVSSVVDYRLQFATRAALHHTISCVSDFINTQHLTGNTQEAGDLHNARCIMQNPFQNETLLRLYDAHKLSKVVFRTQKPIWTQVFREHFPRLTRRITAHRMAEYDASILCCAADPGKLLAHLTATHLLDVHRAICNIFATSENLFFITEVQRGTITSTVLSPAVSPWGGVPYILPVQREIHFRCLGYVSGQQQGQLQEGDTVVHVHGVRDHLVYRRSAKALVARLSTEQSLALKFANKEVRRLLNDTEIIIE